MRHFYLLLGTILSIIMASCDSNSGGTNLISPGGFPYVFVTDADGAVVAPGQYAEFNYTQTMGDSLVGSSNVAPVVPRVKIPTPEELKAQPNPLIEGLSLMSKGDSIRVSIHRDSIPNIPPDLAQYEFLHIDIKMENVYSEEEYQTIIAAEKAEKDKLAAAYKERLTEVETVVAQTIKDYNSGKLSDKLATTSSGLKYVVHENGKGARTKKNEMVNVMYYGALTSDGSRFDDSFSRGEPISFPLGVGRVIAGWDEGLSLLPKGSKASLLIPSDLAYGEAGSPPNIPPNSELYFYVEVNE